MKIKCPHCQSAFNPKEAILKSRKEDYRWYEFSGNNSFCPLCEKQYQADISKVGMVWLLVFICVSWSGMSMGYDLLLIPLGCIAIICVNKFSHIFIKVEPR
jgi:hypothetical protein